MSCQVTPRTLLIRYTPLLAIAWWDLTLFPTPGFSSEEGSETHSNIKNKNCQRANELSYKVNSQWAQCSRGDSIDMYVTNAVMIRYCWEEGFQDWSQRPGRRVRPIESTTKCSWPGRDFMLKDITCGPPSLLNQRRNEESGFQYRYVKGKGQVVQSCATTLQPHLVMELM